MLFYDWDKPECWDPPDWVEIEDDDGYYYLVELGPGEWEDHQALMDNLY